MDRKSPDDSADIVLKLILSCMLVNTHCLCYICLDVEKGVRVYYRMSEHRGPDSDLIENS